MWMVAKAQKTSQIVYTKLTSSKVYSLHRPSRNGQRNAISKATSALNGMRPIN